jgi:hypothetical protein
MSYGDLVVWSLALVLVMGAVLAAPASAQDTACRNLEGAVVGGRLELRLQDRVEPETAFEVVVSVANARTCDETLVVGVKPYGQDVPAVVVTQAPVASGASFDHRFSMSLARGRHEVCAELKDPSGGTAGQSCQAVDAGPRELDLEMKAPRRIERGAPARMRLSGSTSDGFGALRVLFREPGRRCPSRFGPKDVASIRKSVGMGPFEHDFTRRFSTPGVWRVCGFLLSGVDQRRVIAHVRVTR